MTFLKASDLPAIPTYRVLDSDGELVDKSRGQPNVSDEQVLEWYKNMLSGVPTYKNPKGLIQLLILDSERHGRGDVRSTETRPLELLHGMYSQSTICALES